MEQILSRDVLKRKRLGVYNMIDDQPDLLDLEAQGFSLRAFLIRDWPYLAMLGSAVLGVAFTSIAPEPMTAYWEILVPFFAAVCVLTRWRDSQHQKLLWRLIRIEALHWGAVLVAMQLVFITDVRQMMNAIAAGLMVMTLLALGTFTAGAQIGAWRICLVGAVLAMGVPFAAWLARATLLLLLAGILLSAFVAFAFAHHRHGEAPREP
jgi:hypothetical protein